MFPFPTYPLQYSGLENSMDCIVHGIAKSQTRLSDFHYSYYLCMCGRDTRMHKMRKIEYTKSSKQISKKSHR